MRRIWHRAMGLLMALLAGCALAGMAEARGYLGGGVHVGVAPPGFVGPPVYVSPYPHRQYDHPYYDRRRYYPPAPYYAVPGPYSRPAASEGCYAGAYVCPLEAPSLVGMPCSCPTTQGPAWGRAR